MQRKKVVIVAVIIIAVMVIAMIVWFWPKLSGESPVDKGDAEAVVQETVTSFDEQKPDTFLAMQDVCDLGNDGIEPLLDRADSLKIKDQWTAVVGLNTIARGLNTKDCILHQMKAFTRSPFLTIQLYAAASLAENGDLSGKDVLLAALQSDEMMMFMEPAKPAKVFANSVLEYATGKDFAFDEADNDADNAEAVKKWGEYFNK